MSEIVNESGAMHDGFGRRIDYVRLSLTDRCDLRCRYCMSETMVFSPRADVLTHEEIGTLARAFVARGVKRIRLTGGEPLVRRGAIDVVRDIGQLIGHGLDELTLSTNGTHLAAFAGPLREAGIRRVNVSMDTRDPLRFRQITRHGDIAQVLAGVAAAKSSGLSVKINMVALKSLNEDEIESMALWCADNGFGLSLIETMPLGHIDDERTDRYLPLTIVKERLEARWTLVPSTEKTGGPARYWRIPEIGLTLGLISPLTQNFCAGCNRIRVSATGKLYACLGHDEHIDLRAALRGDGDIDAAIDRALTGKPARHAFDLTRPATTRHMSVTGG